MSGSLVLIGVLVFAGLLLAPSVAARAQAKLANAAPVREIAAPIYMKYDTIAGDVSLKGGDGLKLTPAMCKHIEVVAMPVGGEVVRKAGNSGPEMRKAGGEQEFRTTAAFEGGKCVYSLKVGAPGNYTLGVVPIHLKPSNEGAWDDKHKSDPQYLKTALEYKEQKGLNAWFLKYGPQYDKWVKIDTAAGGVFLKGEYKELKLDDKSAVQGNFPLYLTLNGDG